MNGYVMLNKKKLTFEVLLFITLLIFGVNAKAQQKIKGKVVDAQTSEALPGVNVVVANTTIGAVTNRDGKYEITVPANTDSLLFSYIGYSTQRVAINGRTTINIKLAQKIITGQQLVVVGYGTEKKEDLTGSVSSVSAKDFSKVPARDAASLIQGKVPGLIVSTTSGDPTAGTEISLRGFNTLQGSNTPLVLVDGIPGSMNTVAPENISSISVLKGGSAAAIYGSRGANGVILITTKKSHGKQQPTISYDSYVNVQTIAKRPQFLTGNDYRNLIKQGYNLTDYGHNTDWLSLIMRTPISQNHDITLMGGDSNTSYTASLNYKNWQGVFLHTNNRQYTGNLNIRQSMFNNRLKTNLNAIIQDQTYWTGGDGYSFDSNVYREALMRNPTDVPYDSAGNYVYRSLFDYNNPLVLLNERGGHNENRNMRLNGTIQFEPIKNLNIKVLGSSDKSTQIRGFAETSKDVSNVKLGQNAYASRGTGGNSDQLLEITANYQNSIGENQFTVLGGYSWEQQQNVNYYMTNYNFPTDLFAYNNMGSGNALANGNGQEYSIKQGYKLIGFFGRLNYNYNNKYLLMASMRYEGSSKFGANHKWGYFPAVSVGWRISQEKFMKNITFINNLKIRAGYGVTGITPGEDYASLTAYQYGGKIYDNGNWIQGISPARNPNPNLSWEQKEEFDIGLDFDVWNEHISGSIDAYKNNTNKLLWNYSVPVPPYLYNTILANVGEISNKGIEAQVQYNLASHSAFNWTSSVDFSTNRNKLVKLSNNQFKTQNNYVYEGYIGAPIELPTTRLQIGGPIGNFYGYKSVGVTSNGEWMVLNKDGKAIPFTQSTLADRRVIGNGVPKYNLSWNNTVTYKNWDLSMTMHGAFGFQINNFQRQFYGIPAALYQGLNVLSTAFEKVYGKRAININQQQTFVSYFVENGDYWKVDNVTLGYSFDVHKLNAIKRARIYVSGENLITITGYSGMDPEVSTTGLAPGNDGRYKYPTTRTFTLGINLTF